MDYAYEYRMLIQAFKISWLAQPGEVASFFAAADRLMAKEDAEADARAKVAQGPSREAKLANLAALRARWMDGRSASAGHFVGTPTLDPLEGVLHDLGYQKALMESVAAEMAYKDALREAVKEGLC